MGVAGYLVTQFREAPSKRRLVRSLMLGMRGGDRTLVSSDGTTLSARKSGDGDPVVMVHGALSGIGTFSMIELTVAERYAVWVYDRRGRGGSGDGPDYSIDREIEDLQAVLTAAGGPAHVVGHSYGALIALAAAGSGTPMRSLTLYEPPLRQDQLDRTIVAEVAALVDRGDVDQAITTMATGLAGISHDELAVPRKIKPLWNQFRDGATVIERELDVVGDLDWSRFELPIEDLPVLAIKGGRDCAPVYPRVEDLPRFVADPEIVSIPDQGHVAVSYAPNAFADAVLGFIDRH